MATLYKQDLAKMLAPKIGKFPAFAQDLITGVFDEIALALSKGEAVHISGFGEFHIKRVGAKRLRNPRNGEYYDVPEKSLPGFKAAPKLKERVQGSGLGGQVKK